MKYQGEFEELAERLTQAGIHGAWDQVADRYRFDSCEGGIMNWWPKTGTITFQGKPRGKTLLEAQVAQFLAGEQGIQEGSTSQAVTPEAPQPAAAKQIDADAQEMPRPVALGSRFTDSELVVGLVGAVGTELDKVIRLLGERLKVARYEVMVISISNEVIPKIVPPPDQAYPDEYARISASMDAGNKARQQSGDNSVLALGATSIIASGRKKDADVPCHSPRHAYIIRSLKHPAEVERLREIYREGFYLIGVHADTGRRKKFLVEDKRIASEDADRLVFRDEDEHLAYGQRVTDTFHLSDFFVRLDGNDDRLKRSLWRIVDILFGSPYWTPTFDEYAMFLAYAAALRSADLSRQVGAVVAKGDEIMATGANDCPKFGGGLYWPELHGNEVRDREGGRDYTRGRDQNAMERRRIIDEIVQQGAKNGLDEAKLRATLEASRIRDITEFGRVVHAEMEALLSCARSNIRTVGATLYCTTFPCHNCAKHIIAAGIRRVAYIEPYPKSKAAEFHNDSIKLGFENDVEGREDDRDGFVRFEPFVGVGPRRFFDLFSMHLGSGRAVRRKDHNGMALRWRPEEGHLRLQMLPCSYLDLELVASDLFHDAVKSEDVRDE